MPNEAVEKVTGDGWTRVFWGYSNPSEDADRRLEGNWRGRNFISAFAKIPLGVFLQPQRADERRRSA